ncbi:expressed protein [Phakopsora pachyrhizi]|uniref:Mitotic-spindle organizing protein 1 n=1 Tax=Phakopsora pachyrhizi TaxID=170000 RepID=A0AAV0BPX4_PHAPC|nr:expressed protein [Phakopsora pachyrhizi]
MKVLFEISQLLGTGIDRQTLALCIGMIEEGTNPIALAVSHMKHSLPRAHTPYRPYVAGLD